MKKEIYPAIIAKNQKEFNVRYQKIKDIKNTIHLDVMEKPFVKNESLNFSVELPKRKYQVHLMTTQIEEFINENYTKTSSIIFHYEATTQPSKIIKLIKKKKRKVGLAINPKTNIQKIKKYIKNIDILLIMTVDPGKYGAPFKKDTLNKIREAKKQNPKLKIQVDGSVNEKTIKEMQKAGASAFTVGSYIQKSKNPVNSYNKLKEILKVNKI